MTDLINPIPAPPPDPVEMFCSNLPRPERVLYRYEINVTTYEYEGYRARVWLHVFPVTRETEASWFFDEWGRERHVLKGYGKRYAHDTLEKALHSLRKRTSWRQSYAIHALNQAHAAIDEFNRVFPDAGKLVPVGST